MIIGYNRYLTRCLEDKMKPKENKGYVPGIYDNCQTPPYALEPLYQYIDTSFVWECAAGKGVLARQLNKVGIGTVATDISLSKGVTYNDFMSNGGIQVFTNGSSQPDLCTIVTNPPYSIKYEWLERCYELGKPFALLMPVEMLGTAKGQRLFNEHGIEVIFMSPRVDFYMPNKGYEGGGAQFPTAWFTWKLNLPNQINFATLNKPKRSELKEYWEKYL